MLATPLRNSLPKTAVKFLSGWPAPHSVDSILYWAGVGLDNLLSPAHSCGLGFCKTAAPWPSTEAAAATTVFSNVICGMPDVAQPAKLEPPPSPPGQPTLSFYGEKMPLQEKTLPGCNPSPWKQSSNDPLQGEAEEAAAHTAGSSAAWLSSNQMNRVLVPRISKTSGRGDAKRLPKGIC